MCVCICVCVHVWVAQLCLTLQPHGLYITTFLWPWNFSSQEHWSGLLCLFLGDLPHSGIKPRSPTLQIDSLLSEPPGKLESIGTSKNKGQVLYKKKKKKKMAQWGEGSETFPSFIEIYSDLCSPWKNRNQDGFHPDIKSTYRFYHQSHYLFKSGIQRSLWKV